MKRLRNRRDFFGMAGTYAAGLLVGNQLFERERVVHGSTIPSKVSFVNGTDRRDMVYDALMPFKDSIERGIQGKQIILKPNVVSGCNSLSVTHLDILRGVLDFLFQLTDQKIIIGESSTTPEDTLSNYEIHGYYTLKKEYPVELVDFNRTTSTTVYWIKDFSMQNVTVPMNIADPYLNPNNYFISLANFKTHGNTVCTLSIKNFIMSSPLNVLAQIPDCLPSDYVKKWIIAEKSKMHLGTARGLNYNIVRVACHIRPQLAILDGVTGMEGEGPAHGTPVEQGVVLASPDMVAVDRVAIELMGIDYNYVKHVQYCSVAGVGQGNLNEIEILGPDINEYKIPYKMTSNFFQQTKWIENEPDVVEEFSSLNDVAQVEEHTPYLTISNYPNPFNQLTTIQFNLPSSGYTSLVIYNIRGQKVRKLVSERLKASTYSIMWDGKNDSGSLVSSGVYISHLEQGNNVKGNKMILIK